MIQCHIKKRERVEVENRITTYINTDNVNIITTPIYDFNLKDLARQNLGRKILIEAGTGTGKTNAQVELLKNYNGFKKTIYLSSLNAIKDEFVGKTKEFATPIDSAKELNKVGRSIIGIENFVRTIEDFTKSNNGSQILILVDEAHLMFDNANYRGILKVMEVFETYLQEATILFFTATIHNSLYQLFDSVYKFTPQRDYLVSELNGYLVKKPEKWKKGDYYLTSVLQIIDRIQAENENVWVLSNMGEQILEKIKEVIGAKSVLTRPVRNAKEKIKSSGYDNKKIDSDLEELKKDLESSQQILAEAKLNNAPAQEIEWAEKDIATTEKEIKDLLEVKQELNGIKNDFILNLNGTYGNRGVMTTYGTAGLNILDELKEITVIAVANKEARLDSEMIAQFIGRFRYAKKVKLITISPYAHIHDEFFYQNLDIEKLRELFAENNRDLNKLFVETLGYTEAERLILYYYYRTGRGFDKMTSDLKSYLSTPANNMKITKKDISPDGNFVATKPKILDRDTAKAVKSDKTIYQIVLDEERRDVEEVLNQWVKGNYETPFYLFKNTIKRKFFSLKSIAERLDGDYIPHIESPMYAVNFIKQLTDTDLLQYAKQEIRFAEFFKKLSAEFPDYIENKTDFATYQRLVKSLSPRVNALLDMQTGLSQKYKILANMGYGTNSTKGFKVRKRFKEVDFDHKDSFEKTEIDKSKMAEITIKDHVNIANNFIPEDSRIQFEQPSLATKTVEIVKEPEYEEPAYENNKEVLISFSARESTVKGEKYKDIVSKFDTIKDKAEAGLLKSKMSAYSSFEKFYKNITWREFVNKIQNDSFSMSPLEYKDNGCKREFADAIEQQINFLLIDIDESTETMTQIAERITFKSVITLGSNPNNQYKGRILVPLSRNIKASEYAYQVTKLAEALKIKLDNSNLTLTQRFIIYGRGSIETIGDLYVVPKMPKPKVLKKEFTNLETRYNSSNLPQKTINEIQDVINAVAGGFHSAVLSLAGKLARMVDKNTYRQIIQDIYHSRYTSDGKIRLTKGEMNGLVKAYDKWC